MTQYRSGVWLLCLPPFRSSDDAAQAFSPSHVTPDTRASYFFLLPSRRLLFGFVSRLANIIMNRLFGSLQSLLDSLPLPPLFSNAIDLATRQVHELKSYSTRLSVNYERLVEAAAIYLVPTLHFLRRRLSATTRKQRKARRAHRSKSLRHTAVQRLITVLLGVVNRILSTVDRPTRKKSQVLLAIPTKLSARQRFPFAFREIRHWRYERVMSMIMHVGIWMMDTFFWMCNRWSKKRPTDELYLSSQARLVAPKSFGEPPLGIPPYSDELSWQKEKLRLRRRWSWPAPAFPNTALNDADFSESAL